ncbi:mannitol dehydrogenase family protein [Microbacterium sp.]|uniref:mannitol dehydrogenase family protein n=1 Tax=Microbacterium sp. TaxID=51671 RepID=UPI0037C95D6B
MSARSVDPTKRGTRLARPKQPSGESWDTPGGPDIATALERQDGLYTLLTRSDEDDEAEIVGSIRSAVDGRDTATFVQQFEAPETAIATLTITEAGYRLPVAGDGHDTIEIGDDLALLTAISLPRDTDALPTLRTPLARLLLGLERRRLAGAPPIALVPCDNLPANGTVLRDALHHAAERTFPELIPYLSTDVTYVSTSVDRITPQIDPSVPKRVAELTGFADDAAVVAEPFSSWLLSGDFPAGRPSWDAVGAKFVTDIEPFELRKLWLLNGAHSFLAYAGLLRRHTTVADAMTDQLITAGLEEFWNEAARNLPSSVDLDLDAYRSALLSRFHNRAMADALTRIGRDGVGKLRARIAPVLRAERAAGRRGTGAARVLSYWVEGTLASRLPSDAASAAIDSARSRVRSEARRALVALVVPELADDEELLGDTMVLAEFDH